MLTPHPLHFVQHLLPQEKAWFRYTLDSPARVILSRGPTRSRSVNLALLRRAPKVRQAQDDTFRCPSGRSRTAKQHRAKATVESRAMPYNIPTLRVVLGVRLWAWLSIRDDTRPSVSAMCSHFNILFAESGRCLTILPFYDIIITGIAAIAVALA